MALDEREVVQQAMEALSVRTVILDYPDSGKEVTYEDGELVGDTTAVVYAFCIPQDNGSWKCTRYRVVEVKPAFEAQSPQQAVKWCLERFSVDEVFVVGKDWVAWYENGEWTTTLVEDKLATAAELDIPFAVCTQIESGGWFGFPPGGEPDDEEMVILG